jgi:hypothetical protein
MRSVGCVYWNRQVNANSLVISVAEKPMAAPRGQAMRPAFVAPGLVRSRQRRCRGTFHFLQQPGTILPIGRHRVLLLAPWASRNARASAGAARPTDCRGHRSGVIGSGKRYMRGGRLCDLAQEITSIAQF